MLSFFACTAGLIFDPVILVTGILTGYLFHADMKKLAWGLLLFVLPALPTVWPVAPQGIVVGGLAQLAAASMVAAVSYRAFEFAKTRYSPVETGKD